MRNFALLPVLVSVACGGGGGGEDEPALDLNGWWDHAARDNGSFDVDIPLR